MEENLPNNTTQPQVPPEIPVSSVDTQPQQAPNKKFIIIVVIFFAILITGGAMFTAYLLMNNNTNKSSVNNAVSDFPINKADLTPIAVSPTEATTYLPTATPYENPFTATSSSSDTNPFSATGDNPFNNLQ